MNVTCGTKLSRPFGTCRSGARYPGVVTPGYCLRVPPGRKHGELTATGCIARGFPGKDQTNSATRFNSPTNLASATWANLGNPITATNGTISATDTPGPNQPRFYRAIVVLP